MPAAWVGGRDTGAAAPIAAAAGAPPVLARLLRERQHPGARTGAPPPITPAACARHGGRTARRCGLRLRVAAEGAARPSSSRAICDFLQPMSLPGSS